MPPPNEQSESAHILPRPELNPLVNPRLSENMGRWAEVYFTSPPEKREQAVLELLKELESGNPVPQTKAKSQPVTFPVTKHFPDPEVPEVSASEDAAPLTHCRACGHVNPALHQFCGMCGTKMSPDFPPEFEEDDSRAEPALERQQSDRRFVGSNRGLHAATSRVEARVASPVRSLDEPIEDAAELSRLRRISENSFADDDTLNWNLDATSSRPYRLYVGAALAVVAFVLLYLAWRSSQDSQNAYQVSPAPPVATSDRNLRPAAPSSPPGTASTPTPIQKVEAPATTPATPPAAASPIPGAVANNNAETRPRRGEMPSGPAVQPASSEAPPAFSETGADELAIARRYLNGGNGVQRNPTEAAQWLWKSVAKHDSEATLLLADLYLKGDGVPRNCDQARVLLDSAARKGIAGAGERLRHLPAFGCQ